MLNNYIPDRNRWHMSPPPQWWKQRLYDFDSELRVLPSRKTPCVYILARVAKHTIADKNILNRESDTAMCASYGLVYVARILRTGPDWQIDNLLNELRAADTWKYGRTAEGLDRLVKELHQAEADQEQKLKAEMRDMFWNRAGDAYRSYKARTGQRTKLNPPVPKSGAIVPSTGTLEH